MITNISRTFSLHPSAPSAPGHLKVNCPKGKRGHPGVPLTGEAWGFDTMKVTALIIISLKENAQGRRLRYTAGPNAGSTATPPVQDPDGHTIPNVILLSCDTNVKHNCAKFAAGLEKSLCHSPKPFWVMTKPARVW